MSQWMVYVLRCSDNTLYTGVTTDLQRRLQEHNQSDKNGAKYTRVRRPVDLVYTESCDSRSDALKREHGIRKLTRQQKELLIQNKL